MYALAKLFLCILCCLLERKISLLSRSLGCKLLLVLTKEHMFLFDQKSLVIETPWFVEKEMQAQDFTQAGRETG